MRFSKIQEMIHHLGSYAWIKLYNFLSIWMGGGGVNSVGNDSYFEVWSSYLIINCIYLLYCFHWLSILCTYNKYVFFLSVIQNSWSDLSSFFFQKIMYITFVVEFFEKQNYFCICSVGWTLNFRHLDMMQYALFISETGAFWTGV